MSEDGDGKRVVNLDLDYLLDIFKIMEKATCVTFSAMLYPKLSQTRIINCPTFKIFLSTPKHCVISDISLEFFVA